MWVRKTDSELENNHCPLHPSKEIEIREEENYFFKFSAFQDKLLKLYDEQPDFVVPTSRFNEIKAFVGRGLEDFSISRLASKMPWGIPVPDDPSQTMYVWFDALVNYISAIGWPHSAEATRGKPGKFFEWWPPARSERGSTRSGGVTQIAGKDNLRQQSAMWQAMLMACDLPPSKQIIIHGFITSGGQKMSKSLGNVINPLDLVRNTVLTLCATTYFATFIRLKILTSPWKNLKKFITRIWPTVLATLSRAWWNWAKNIWLPKSPGQSSSYPRTVLGFNYSPPKLLKRWQVIITI